MIKTNVMRILEQKKINYQSYYYDCNGNTDGVYVAMLIGANPKRVFKSLVTVANTKEYFVFMVPVDMSLDLKKAALAVGVKSISLIKSKDLLLLTGYIHGGCSPIGMKKQFVTVVDNQALDYQKIIFSAGKIGSQVEIAPLDLEKVIKVDYKDIKE